MSSEKTNTTKPEDLKELQGLVDRAKRHQEALGLSDKDFCDRYREYVGSAKTWRYRLLEEKYDEVRIARMLPRLRALAASLDGGSPMEEFFEDLPVWKEFHRYYRLLLGRKSDRRCMVMLAQTGCGKSACGREVCRRYPESTVYARCRPTWKNRPIRIINGLAGACGITDGGVADEVFGRLIAKLKANPKTIVVDEAHDGGVMLLKLIKTLIDETQCRFAILAFPTVWRRLVLGSDDAHAEAQQLYGRTLKPVFDAYSAGTSAANVAAMLRASLGFNGHSDDVAGEIFPIVRGNGNLRLVADIIETADTLFQETGEEITGDGVIQLARQYSAKGAA
ncbi:MAG: AAA family ATPase [Verrucomicrobiota bacterium]